MMNQFCSCAYYSNYDRRIDEIQTVAYEIKAKKFENIQANKVSNKPIDKGKKSKSGKSKKHQSSESTSKKSSHRKKTENTKEKINKMSSSLETNKNSELSRPIQGDMPKKKITYLGIYRADPEEYVREYGGILKYPDQVQQPKIAESQKQRTFTSRPYFLDFNLSEEELTYFLSQNSRKTSGKNTPFMVRCPTPKLLDVDMKPRFPNKRVRLISSNSSSSSLDINESIDKIVGSNQTVQLNNIPKTPNGYLLDKDGRRVSAFSNFIETPREDKETRMQKIIQQINVHLKKKNETRNI